MYRAVVPVWLGPWWTPRLSLGAQTFSAIRDQAADDVADGFASCENAFLSAQCASRLSKVLR
ncbi:MAG: hypothetical protein DME42_11190 [Verrucomicrobia bacterium]|nr:MAG: hypothetical protein DME42_11190 [Verrucomicrobiota bacterium]